MRAAYRDSVQRRETRGAKEFQVGQIKDQLAATRQVGESILGEGVCVCLVDLAVGADDGHRRLRPSSVQSRQATVARRGDSERSKN